MKMKTILLSFFLLNIFLASFSIEMAEKKTNTDINILKYGAIADGKTDNTRVIQKAIDECSESGGG